MKEKFIKKLLQSVTKWRIKNRPIRQTERKFIQEHSFIDIAPLQAFC